MIHAMVVFVRTLTITSGSYMTYAVRKWPRGVRSKNDRRDGYKSGERGFTAGPNNSLYSVWDARYMLRFFAFGASFSYALVHLTR